MRRYSDFYWLRNILVREYPGHYVPPMAEKTGRSFKEDRVSERMGDLQRFMESIAANRELKSSMYVLNFLKCIDTKQFSKIKKDFDKKLGPGSDFRKQTEKKMKTATVHAISNVDGFLTSKVNPVLKNYAINISALQN